MGPVHRARVDQAFVYLLANRRRGTLYVGVTSDLIRRMYQHREGTFEGFTSDHGVKHLVWFESTPSIVTGIAREKQLKNWKRDWKIALVEKMNPTWRDRFPTILG